MPRVKAPRKSARGKAKRTTAPGPPPSRLTLEGVTVSEPQFGETKHTSNPVQFLHAVKDTQYYKEVEKESASQLIKVCPGRVISRTS